MRKERKERKKRKERKERKEVSSMHLSPLQLASSNHIHIQHHATPRHTTPHAAHAAHRTVYTVLSLLLNILDE